MLFGDRILLHAGPHNSQKKDQQTVLVLLLCWQLHWENYYLCYQRIKQRTAAHDPGTPLTLVEI
jgi:hypothetical protein